MTKILTLALFGEAEKGKLCQGILCQTLPQLIDIFGHPPPSSQGITIAIQTLLYGSQLIYFRVREEGYSHDDYLTGIREIGQSDWISKIAAFAIPGVGDEQIISAIMPLCAVHHSLLITSQADLYDYLTSYVA